MDRRSFFHRCVPVVGGLTAVAAPAVPRALHVQHVNCPRCLYVQPSPIVSQFPDYVSYVAHVTTPQRIRCYNLDCGWEGMATFARFD